MLASKLRIFFPHCMPFSLLLRRSLTLGWHALRLCEGRGKVHSNTPFEDSGRATQIHSNLKSKCVEAQVIVCLAIVLGTVSTDRCGFAAEPVNFDRDIRPILSEHCYTCHGPDAGKLQAGLRLDQKESTFGRLESGSTAVVAGKPNESELVRRIHSQDADEVMPPPDGKPLSSEQIAALENWIASGATWTNHWAFERIQSPPVPTATSGRVNNAIDNFILTKLLSHGLTQSPQEGKERLIRRATLDLTGLPPTIKEVDDFLADESPLAFERVVDRLLCSQHFGERLALPWLDLARYGDTSGYHNDSLRDMWLWREWVIGAFNKNLPSINSLSSNWRAT